MKLEVLCGMIASGKSTYARKRADEGALVVAHDSLVDMLHVRYRYEQGLRDCYRKMEESIAWAALDAGRDVVIDRTHLTVESRQRWITWASYYDSLRSSEGKGPTTRVVAVRFPITTVYVHAARRFEHDARGRSFEVWYKVALNHLDQANKEPLGDGEGFDSIEEA